ncbi:nitroreductase/quinone reductase family protein [Streptomyces sp. NPDC002574]|uniref:nitroreductase/quinone reductase family protein n=1 Tax=Streptomyces sp. NPDC002574 TaxID=3364652 RepID=UPI00367A4FE4
MTDTAPDTHDMVVIHRIFPREFGLLADLIRRAPAGDPQRAADIAEHLEFTLDVLYHHHSAEDQYLWPRLLQRAQPQTDVVQRMRRQHETVEASIEAVRRLMHTWRGDPTVALGCELAMTLTGLRDALSEHLDDEESDILPLVRTHLTVPEWEEVGQKAFEKFPRSAMPIAVGQLLEVATESDRELFFGKLPLPARAMWHLVGRGQYARYIRRVRGVPPRGMHPAVRTLARAANAVAVWLYRTTNGRVAGSAKGVPLLLLTVPGRRTGRPRSVLVGYFHHDGAYVITASAGGAKKDPQWISNLKAARQARVQLGGEHHVMNAWVAEGVTRDGLWTGVVLARAPFFGQYQEKSGRVIPIAVLQPGD